MKHRSSNRILGRNNANRRSLLQNLTSGLLKHGAIETTQAKAKELRRHIEPLITSAKKELTLARRRRLLSQLAQPGDLLELLTVAKRSQKKNGGYLRLIKLAKSRSDEAKMVKVEIID